MFWTNNILQKPVMKVKQLIGKKKNQNYYVLKIVKSCKYFTKQ